MNVKELLVRGTNMSNNQLAVAMLETFHPKAVKNNILCFFVRVLQNIGGDTEIFTECIIPIKELVLCATSSAQDYLHNSNSYICSFEIIPLDRVSAYNLDPHKQFNAAIFANEDLHTDLSMEYVKEANFKKITKVLDYGGRTTDVKDVSRVRIHSLGWTEALSYTQFNVKPGVQKPRLESALLPPPSQDLKDFLGGIQCENSYLSRNEKPKFVSIHPSVDV